MISPHDNSTRSITCRNFVQMIVPSNKGDLYNDTQVIYITQQQVTSYMIRSQNYHIIMGETVYF